MTIVLLYDSIITMTYSTILTIKGTTTIPQEIRKKLDIRPGMRIEFSENDNGEYVIKRAQTIDDVRELNAKALKLAGTQDKQYQSGDAFTIGTDKS